MAYDLSSLTELPEVVVTPDDDRKRSMTKGAGGREPGLSQSRKLSKQEVIDYWKSKGATDAGAQGITEALIGESGLDPLVVNKDSGATGIGQHLGSRKNDLLALPNWQDPYVQLNFMHDEVLGKDPEASKYWNQIKNASSAGEAKKLWDDHFERSKLVSGLGKPGAPSVSFASSGVDFERDRSDTNVIGMDPLEFLSLLAPIESDAKSKEKGDSLRKSLLQGDQIEAIPSLEVKPKRGSLNIVDWDGRHRAQAAADAGLDTIPVSIRGVPELSDYTKLIGERGSIDLGKLNSYGAQAQTPQPQAQPQPPAQIGPTPAQVAQLTPPPGGPAVAPTARYTPPTPASLPSTVPPKIDYGPEISAGINRGVMSPLSEAYRNVAVSSPADNVTPGQRIANANAESAGQIGIPPTSNALTSFLGQFNPIGSAQAAEAQASGAPQPQATAAIPPQGGYDLSSLPPAPGGAPGQYDMSGLERRQPAPYIPGVSDIAPPILNALTGIPRALSADVAALGQGNMPWRDINAFNRARENALQAINERNALPETPTGRALSSIIDVPARLLGWAGENILGLGGDLARGTPWGTTAADIHPYMPLASDIIGAATLRPGVGNAVSRPLNPVLRQITKTPEQAGVGAINRDTEANMAAGAQPPVAEIRRNLESARTADIPLVPFDMMIRGEPTAQLFANALKHAPEAKDKLRTFDRERTEGVRETESAEPKGGFLDRLTRHIETFFGRGQAPLIEKELKASLDKTKQELQKENVKSVDTGVLSQKSKDLANKYNNDSAALEGLRLGRNIYSTMTRVEDIRSFLGKNTRIPDAAQHLKIGISYTVRDKLRNVKPGRELGAIDSTQNLRNKLTEALQNSRLANEFWGRIENEGRVAQGSDNAAKILSDDMNAVSKDSALMRRVLEAVGHVGAATIAGHHAWGAPYWMVRGGRQALDYISSGGGITAKTRGKEIVDALLNPDAVLAAPQSRSRPQPFPQRPSSNVLAPRTDQLFMAPPLSPGRQNVLSGIRQLGPPVSFGAAQGQVEANQ